MSEELASSRLFARACTHEAPECSNVAEMNCRARDDMQGLLRGETPPPTWHQDGGCLDTRLKGTGKSLASHTQSSTIPLMSRVSLETRKNGRGWYCREIQPEQTRKLLSCDVCSIMFCAGVKHFQGGWSMVPMHSLNTRLPSLYEAVFQHGTKVSKSTCSM